MIRTITTLIVTSFFFLGSISLKAADNKALEVNLIDGTSVEYVTSEGLKITYEGDNVKFESTSATAIYPRSSVVNFKFKNVTSSVEKIEVPNKTEFQLFKDYIHVTSSEKLATPRIFNISGQLISTKATRVSDNSLQVSISSLPKGIFIININNQSFKFLKN